MGDSFFKQRFNASKCKTMLKLTIPRIKLLRNRREMQLKQMRREIAKLIGTGQEATARIRVEHIIREEKMLAAQEIVELFCELIAVRLPIIESQKECPLDLKEAISSVCFAAPRCADLTELLQVQLLFATKYGKEFVAAATELMPECGVNRQLVELLSVRAPAPDVKLKLLKEIAEEHELDWDPSASESELLKPHEDLLNGPTQFGSGSKVPLPEAKHEQMTYTHHPDTHATTQQNSDSDADFDALDFPEVPKQPLQSNKVNVSAPEMLPFPASALSDVDDQEEENPFGGNDKPPHLEPQVIVQEKSADEKQFVPFISPPSFPPLSEHNSPPPFTSKTTNDTIDLSDVLAAARSAAETAERAAASARAAANIAQLRISEMVKKRNDQDATGYNVENPFGLDKQKSFADYDSASTSPSQNDGRVADVDSILQSGRVLGQGANDHQPRRLPSMDDEADFSYPNLFKSQGSNLSSHSDSFKDSK